MTDTYSDTVVGVAWVLFGALLFVCSMAIIGATGGHPIILGSVLVGVVVASMLMHRLSSKDGWNPAWAALLSFLVYLLASVLAVVAVIGGLIALVIWLLKQLGGGGNGSSSGYRKTGGGTFSGSYERWEKR